METKSKISGGKGSQYYPLRIEIILSKAASI